MAAPAAPPPAGPAQPMPPPAYGPPPPMYAAPPPHHTALPIAGGAMLLIAGIISISFWAFVAFLGGTLGGLVPIGGGFITGILLVCGAIGMIMSLITLLGGVMALQRKMWGLALAGGILGLFTLGWYFLGSILSLIGLILVAVARKEFP